MMKPLSTFGAAREDAQDAKYGSLLRFMSTRKLAKPRLMLMVI